jgi:hypothetical protein
MNSQISLIVIERLSGSSYEPVFDIAEEEEVTWFKIWRVERMGRPRYLIVD